MLAAGGDPAGVRRLVLVDPVWTTSAWMAPLRDAVLTRLDGERRDAVAHISEESLGNPDAALHSAYSRAVYPAWFTSTEMAARFTPPEAMSETGAAVLARLRRDGYDWRQRVRAVSAPTLVIHGEEDPLPLAASLHDSYIGTARLVTVAAAGHMPFWEAPGKFFALVESSL